MTHKSYQFLAKQFKKILVDFINSSWLLCKKLLSKMGTTKPIGSCLYVHSHSTIGKDSDLGGVELKGIQ